MSRSLRRAQSASCRHLRAHDRVQPPQGCHSRPTAAPLEASVVVMTRAPARSKVCARSIAISGSSSTMRTKRSVRILPMTNPPLTKDRRFQIDRVCGMSPSGAHRSAVNEAEDGSTGEGSVREPLNKRWAYGRVPAQGTSSEQGESNGGRPRFWGDVAHGFRMGSARRMRAHKLTDFVRGEARAARG